jgi:hypothetical protein
MKPKVFCAGAIEGERGGGALIKTIGAMVL